MENSSRNQGEYPECTDKSLEFRKKRKECDSCFVISEACIALRFVVLLLPSYVLRPQTMVTNKPSRCVSFDGQIMHQDSFCGRLTCQSCVICDDLCVFHNWFSRQQHVMFLGSGNNPPRHLRLPE